MIFILNNAIRPSFHLSIYLSIALFLDNICLSVLCVHAKCHLESRLELIKSDAKKRLPCRRRCEVVPIVFFI